MTHKRFPSLGSDIREVSLPLAPQPQPEAPQWLCGACLDGAAPTAEAACLEGSCLRQWGHS